MKSKIPLYFVCLLLVGGCATPKPWIGPRPLGNQYHSYLALEEKPANLLLLNEPVGELTLKEALTLSLMKNPELRVYSWEVRQAEAHAIQEGLMPNPEISVETENFGGSDEKRGFINAETTLALSQVIELGFKGTKRRQVAEIETKLKAWDYESKRLDVFTETTKSFIEYTAAIKKLKLAGELLKLSDKTLKTVKKRVSAGKDSEADLKKAQVSNSLTKISFERDKRNVATTRRNLGMLWNSRNPRFSGTTGDLEEIVNIATFDKLKKGLVENPEIARWATEKELREAILSLEKTNRIPDLEISGGIKRNEEKDDYTFLMGLSIAIPIFDFNEGNVKEAELDLQKLPEEELDAKNRIWLSLANTWEELALNYFEIIKLKEQIIPSAKLAYSATFERFQRGKSDYLDVLDAQRTYFETRREYIESLESFHLRVADTERLIAQKIITVEKKGYNKVDKLDNF